MKTFCLGGLLWTGMIFCATSSAQQQLTFYNFSYYKIVPGKAKELRSMIETVDARVQQNRINNGAISSWYLYEVLSPVGTSTEYDYVMITTTNNVKNSFETSYTFDSAFKKTFQGKDSKFFADYDLKQVGAWRLVKEEIYYGLALADSSFPAGMKLKYIVTDFMEPKPGKGAQYYRTEVDTFRIIHRERIKLGAISQWAFLQLVSPYNLRTGYSYLALNFYTDIGQMFDFPGSGYVDALKSTFPNMELSALFQSASDTRDNPRAETLRLFLYALPSKR